MAIAAFCLLWVHGRKRYDGQVFVAFLGLYAIGRFLL
jgi:phosphatidylglycerol:prolipoprotein diacylglycerol transferase